MHTIEHFDDLLRIARAQPEPQRLLLVFASADLPDQPSPRQQAQFAQAQGGTLEPLLCVDKKPAEIASFAALLEESHTLEAPLPSPGRWSLSPPWAGCSMKSPAMPRSMHNCTAWSNPFAVAWSMPTCPSTARASRCSCNRADGADAQRLTLPPWQALQSRHD